jgi:hypothetical protein
LIQEVFAERQDTRIEMALIAYFHQITRKFLKTCSDILDQDVGDIKGSVVGGIPRVNRGEMRLMGLNEWSKTDRELV